MSSIYNSGNKKVYINQGSSCFKLKINRSKTQEKQRQALQIKELLLNAYIQDKCKKCEDGAIMT